MSMTFSDGLSAVRILKMFIQAKLPEVYMGNQYDYGIVRCILEDDEPGEAEQVGGPYILLAMESDEKAAWSTPARPRNQVVARADVIATDFSGAQTGAANEESTDSLLSEALTKIIENYVGEMENLGLKRPSIRADRETITTDENGEVHANPRRISITYFKS